jgi:hypothetical protein
MKISSLIRSAAWSVLTLSFLLVGCDRTVSSDKTTKVGSDGTVKTTEKTVTQTPDGVIKTEETKKTEKP